MEEKLQDVKLSFTNKETGEEFELGNFNHCGISMSEKRDKHIIHNTCIANLGREIEITITCECFDLIRKEEESMVQGVTGSTIRSICDALTLCYLNENNEIICGTSIMSDIVNVEKPNDETVFVEFADGTKEVAHLSKEDTFSLETGILICVVKKLFSEMPILVSGSSAYNKVIKYALTKVDAKKKAKQAEIEEKKRAKAEYSALKQKEREKANKRREARINEMAEAYKRAAKDIAEESSEKLKNRIEELITQLSEYEDDNNE